jgi:hypothetical protein
MSGAHSLEPPSSSGQTPPWARHPCVPSIASPR